MSSLKPRRSSSSRTRTNPPSEVTRESWKSTFNELLNKTERADFVSHPQPVHPRTAPISSKPTSISAFVAFYQIASSLRKWKSGGYIFVPLDSGSAFGADGRASCCTGIDRICAGQRSSGRVRPQTSRKSGFAADARGQMPGAVAIAWSSWPAISIDTNLAPRLDLRHSKGE